MSWTVLLTPNEVAALAETSRTIVEKALEQKVLGASRGARADSRLLPLRWPRRPKSWAGASA